MSGRSLSCGVEDRREFSRLGSSFVAGDCSFIGLVGEPSGPLPFGKGLGEEARDFLARRADDARVGLFEELVELAIVSWHAENGAACSEVFEDLSRIQPAAMERLRIRVYGREEQEKL